MADQKTSEIAMTESTAKMRSLHSQSIDANKADIVNNEEEFVDNEDSDDDELDAMMEDQELKDLETMLSPSQSDKMGLAIMNEVKAAAYEARYLGVFLAFLSLLLSYQIFIAPYPLMNNLDRSLTASLDLGLMRPVLSDAEQRGLRENIMKGETSFRMLTINEEDIKIMFHQSANKHGVHQPPEMFYRGVMFGITDRNSHMLRYTGHKPHNESRGLIEKQDLQTILANMQPKPTKVVYRQVQHNVTGWEEEGWGVYFAYDDLAAQGKLSSDKMRPWKRVLDDILVIARDHRQVYVTVWYPHEYGHPGDDAKDIKRFKKDSRAFTSILQQIVPTRTGLHGIISTVPVWMSAVNRASPKRRVLEEAVEKPWTDDDHWDHYKPNGHKYVKWTKEQLEEMEYRLHPGVNGVTVDSPPLDPPTADDVTFASQQEARQLYEDLIGAESLSRTPELDAEL